MGLAPAEELLAVDGLLAQFAKRRDTARMRYARFVADGIRAESPWKQLKAQVFLGDERFVERMQMRAGPTQREDVQIPVAHRRAPAASLRQIEKEAPDRNAAIVRAHARGTYSYQQIAQHFGIHFTTVGWIVRGIK